MNPAPNAASGEGMLGCCRCSLGTTHPVLAVSCAPVCVASGSQGYEVPGCSSSCCTAVWMSSTSSQHHWGLPCTVSEATSLFPPDLNTDLDTIKLAATPGIKSCFLRVKLGLSVFAAANFAKALRAAWIYTVGDFLGVYHLRWPTHLRHFVEALDRCLAQYPDLPENHHFPPGTCGGCEVARA